MTSDEDQKLRAIHLVVVAQNSNINSLISSIQSDISMVRSLVQAQIRRNINGVTYTKTQKQDNEDTNTIARGTLYGDQYYDGLESVQNELEANGYQIGSPDIIDYAKIGNRVRDEIDKTYLHA